MENLSLTIKVEFLTSTSIENACRELCVFANRLGCRVSTNFNGVILVASPDTNPGNLKARFLQELESDRPVKLAIA